MGTHTGDLDPPSWHDDATLAVGPVRFTCTEYPASSQVDRLVVCKPRSLVDAYLEVLPDHVEGNVVELGINEGGSTALLALVARPRRLLAVELAPQVDALAGFLAAHGLADVVTTAYETDQGDRAALRGLVERTFADEPLDLVIDDASHLLGPTRASFEELFPRLRPGGLYLIEDWRWEHAFAEHVVRSLEGPDTPERRGYEAQVRTLAGAPAATLAAGQLAELVGRLMGEEIGRQQSLPEGTRPRPLASLAAELMVLRASSGGIVADFECNEYWIVVRRGPDEIDAASFDLGLATRDHYGYLSNLR